MERGTLNWLVFWLLLLKNWFWVVGEIIAWLFLVDGGIYFPVSFYWWVQGEVGERATEQNENKGLNWEWFLKGSIEELAFDGLQHFLCDLLQLQAFVLPLLVLLFAWTKILCLLKFLFPAQLVYNFKGFYPPRCKNAWRRNMKWFSVLFHKVSFSSFLFCFQKF